MSQVKAFALASCVGLFGVALAPNVYADQWNKRTILTVNEAIQIPNKTLQPGKYVMRLLDSPSNRHIVQIFDENEQHLVTTVLAIPNYRLQPTGETQFGWWETPAGQPKALRSWFYPGDNFGQEFAYPKNEAMQIASAVKQSVPTTYAQSEADLTTARVGTVDQVGTERELDQQTYSAADTNRQTPAQSQTQDQSQTQTAQNTASTESTQSSQTTQSTQSDLPVGTAAQQPADNSATSSNNTNNTEMAQNRTTPRATGTDQNAGTMSDQNTADRAATPQQLPRTASPYPFIGLIGLMSLAAFGAVSVFAKRGV